jgi:hypothetical protein
MLREFKSECVEAVGARHSEKELSALGNRVSADMTYWRAHGVQVSFVSVKSDGTFVEVGTTDLARARRELPSRYGTAAPLHIVYSVPPQPL